jgi:hypothetical protein
MNILSKNIKKYLSIKLLSVEYLNYSHTYTDLLTDFDTATNCVSILKGIEQVASEALAGVQDNVPLKLRIIYMFFLIS